MPRFVRPAYMTLAADGVATQSATGPRAKDGYLSAALTLRDTVGAVSEPIRIDAGGRFTDGTGRAEIRIPRGMAVEVTVDGIVTVYSADAVRAVTIRPVA